MSVRIFQILAVALIAAIALAVWTPNLFRSPGADPLHLPP